MRINHLSMLIFALICATVAAMLSHTWLSSQSSKESILATTQENPGKPKRSIVIATRDLNYGEKLQPDMLRLVPWPDDVLPKGAFLSLESLTQPNQDRIVLAQMFLGEPVLEGKVSGAAQGLMASKLSESMNAVTIRTNDTSGVAGFVQPDDRVDVFMTLGGKATDTGPASKASVVVLLQNIRVLATDQATQRNIKAAPPKAVTLEVTTEDAQKLVLASSIGQLSLALRRSNEGVENETKPIGMGDLLSNQPVDETGVPIAPANTGQVIGVTRSVERSEYNVRRDPSGEKKQKPTSLTVPSKGPGRPVVPASGSWVPIRND